MSMNHPSLRTLFRELKRRKVVRLLIAYVVAAAGAVQLADAVAPNLELPDRTVTVIIILAIAGLPIAALLAWLYDIVPDANGGTATPNPGAGEPVAPLVPAWPRGRLPIAATPFIGREDELRELCELLENPGTRLVTVLGPGGVGKTRLATHAAALVAGSFRDGVVYRPLSGLSAPEHLVPALAESLGLQPSRREDLLLELESFLRTRHLLFVLDNFDHLTPAAGVLAQLLEHAPGMRVLVTSRERLNLRQETLLALDGLDVAGDAETSEAVRLFVAGARRIDRRFQIEATNRDQVSRICALLNGIPLAIELASAWVRTLSCGEILDQLQHGLDMLSSDAPDVEERHHSLRATFDASWRLLTPEEQSALARLAVFRGAFDSAAAAQVAHADSALLRQLTDKSLLTRTSDRLLMLDMVRSYAHERLSADPGVERRAHERHLAWCAALLQSLEERLRRFDTASIERVADSIDEVRAAWNYATQSRNTAALLRMIHGVFCFYEGRGWAREGAEVFARSSASIGDFVDHQDVARSVRLAAARLDVRHGVLLHRLGDFRAAESSLRRGLAAARGLEDDGEVMFAADKLGSLRHSMGDFAEAERLHQEALALAQLRQDRLAEGLARTHLAAVEWARGGFESAAHLYANALELLREERDLNGMWVTLNNLGVLASSRQDFEEAQRRFREALALQTELKNPRFAAHIHHNLGCAARELGDLAGARKWLEGALRISDEMGYQAMAGLSLVSLAELGIKESDDAAAIAAVHHALRIADASRNYPLALEALLALARLRLHSGDVAGATELGAVLARHPMSDGDIRRRVAELFTDIGAQPPHDTDVVDLPKLVTDVLRTMTAPVDGSAPEPRHHAHTTSE